MDNDRKTHDAPKGGVHHSSLIQDYIRLKDYDRAMNQIEQALVLDPNDSKMLELKTRVLSLKEREKHQPAAAGDAGHGEKESLQSRKQEKLRELEEQRRNLEKIRREFEDLQRKEDELQRQEEEEKRRRAEEQRQLEERKRQEELRRQREEEERRIEEERKRQEELRRKKLEEELRRRQEEERRKQEEFRRREEEKRKQEELKRRKEEEERLRREAEERQKQEELNRKREEERRRKIQELQSQIDNLKSEEEKIIQQEVDAKRKQQEREEKIRQDRQKREEEDRKRAEENRKRDEEQRRKEEELRKREVEHLIQMDPLRRLEEETRIAKEKKDRVLAQIPVAEEMFGRGEYDSALAEVSRILEVEASNPRALTLRLRIKQAQERQKERPVESKEEHVEKLVETAVETPAPAVAGKFPVKMVAGVAAVLLALVAGIVLLRGGKGKEPDQNVGVAQQTSTTENTATAQPVKDAGPTSAANVSRRSIDEILAKANLLVQRHSLQAALQEFDSAAAMTPPRKEAFLGAGNIYVMAGKYSEALRSLSRAVEIAPHDTSALLTSASANILNGTPANGVKFLETAVSLMKDSTRYLTGPLADAALCDRSLLTKYADRLTAAFERVVGGNAKDYATRYRYGRLQMAMGKSKEARALFQKNVDQLVEEFRNRPDDGEVMMDLAISMTQLGHFSEASGFATDAKDMAKGHPRILYRIADMYAIQTHNKSGDAQMKAKSVQALKDAVAARFILDEVTNPDFCDLRSSPEFLAAVRVQLK